MNVSSESVDSMDRDWHATQWGIGSSFDPTEYSRSMPFLSQMVSLLIDSLSTPSSYKDRQYTVNISFYCFREHKKNLRRDIPKLIHTVCRELVLLHNRGTDLRVLWKGRANQKDHHGTGQGAKDAMWILLRRILYSSRCSTCKKYFDGLRLDERYIRVDLDYGFKDGRQYGRGRRGGQVYIISNDNLLGEGRVSPGL